MKRFRGALSCVGVLINIFGLTYGVEEKTPLFIALKVYFRVHSKN